MVVVARGLAPLEDALQDRDQAPARGVAAPEGGQRQVGVHVGEGVGALLEIVEDRDQLGRQLLAERLPDQARARRVDRELGEEVEQIDLAPLAPARDRALGLRRDHLGVAAHHLVAQRLVAQRLLALLGRRVEDHARGRRSAS